MTAPFERLPEINKMLNVPIQKLSTLHFFLFGADLEGETGFVSGKDYRTAISSKNVRADTIRTPLYPSRSSKS